MRPGHEISGHVDALGEGVMLDDSGLMAVEPMDACGHCASCGSGHYTFARMSSWSASVCPVVSPSMSRSRHIIAAPGATIVNVGCFEGNTPIPGPMFFAKELVLRAGSRPARRPR